MSKSPNYMSRNGWKPDMISLHVAEGSFSGTVSWCCNPNSGVSCHFVTGKNGEREQLVDLDKASWCNGTSTIAGASHDYRRSTNRLVRERKTNANYYTISIENEGYSYKDGYGRLTDKQYQTLLQLLKELITKYNIPVDREHIVGHFEISPKEKPNCPGPKFQWDELMRDLTEWKNGTKKPTPTTPATSLKYSKGDKIVLNGYLYRDSYGNGRGSKKTNYKGTITKVNAKGSKPYHIDSLGWVAESDIKKEASSKPKSIDEVAREVINGKWGNGEDRRTRLTNAGYNYDEVQKKVNEILYGAPKKTKSIDAVAREVIEGKWGNNPERKRRLEAEGYNYREVQNRVNQLLR